MNIEIPGNYRISRQLGAGGMGTVYLAHDVRLARDVAIKVISPNLAGKPNLMARFRVEAVAQARLNHPNIVIIHTFEHYKGTYFIVMEYVNGKNLRDILHESPTRSVPVDQALYLFNQLLDGIAYAHQQGVLHRDIKPANIFVTPQLKVKIGDFGIARVSGFEGLTRTGAALGTVLYSSPEQIRGEKTTAPTDIYSLGITLYEMLTGVQPFMCGAGSDWEIQQAHLKKKPDKPSRLNPIIQPILDSVIMKALAKQPAARFPDAVSFKQALQPLLVAPLPQPQQSQQPRLALVTFDKLKNIKNIKNLQLYHKLTDIKNQALDFFKTPPFPPFPAPGAAEDGCSDARKRRLLLILIPLLLLLLIVIAFTRDIEQDPYRNDYRHLHRSEINLKYTDRTLDNKGGQK